MSCPDAYQGAPEPLGAVGCPCLDFATTTALFSDTVTAVIMTKEYAAFNAEDPSFSPRYGTGCGPHDAFTPPYCIPHWASASSAFSMSGGEVINRFCADAWCWVNASNCDVPTPIHSSWFPGVDISYSYETCGATNVFAPFYETELEPNIRGQQTFQLIIGLAVLASVVLPCLLVVFCVHNPRTKWGA